MEQRVPYHIQQEEYRQANLADLHRRLQLARSGHSGYVGGAGDEEHFIKQRIRELDPSWREPIYG